MRGILFVESPLNALKFELDSNAGTYQAKGANYSDRAQLQRHGSMARTEGCGPAWSSRENGDPEGGQSVPECAV